MRKLCVIILSLNVGCLCPCLNNQNQMAIDKKSQLLEYFRTLPKGTNVAVIERTLNLHEPIKRLAPASVDAIEGFKFSYILDNKYFIFFNADFVGRKTHYAKDWSNSKYYIYLGKYDISTLKQRCQDD